MVPVGGPHCDEVLICRFLGCRVHGGRVLDLGVLGGGKTHDGLALGGRSLVGGRLHEYMVLCSKALDGMVHDDMTLGGRVQDVGRVQDGGFWDGGRVQDGREVEAPHESHAALEVVRYGWEWGLDALQAPQAQSLQSHQAQSPLHLLQVPQTHLDHPNLWVLHLQAQSHQNQLDLQCLPHHDVTV